MLSSVLSADASLDVPDDDMRTLADALTDSKKELQSILSRASDAEAAAQSQKDRVATAVMSVHDAPTDEWLRELDALRSWHKKSAALMLRATTKRLDEEIEAADAGAKVLAALAGAANSEFMRADARLSLLAAAGGVELLPELSTVMGAHDARAVSRFDAILGSEGITRRDVAMPAPLIRLTGSRYYRQRADNTLTVFITDEVGRPREPLRPTDLRATCAIVAADGVDSTGTVSDALPDVTFDTPVRLAPGMFTVKFSVRADLSAPLMLTVCCYGACSNSLYACPVPFDASLSADPCVPSSRTLALPALPLLSAFPAALQEVRPPRGVVKLTRRFGHTPKFLAAHAEGNTAALGIGGSLVMLSVPAFEHGCVYTPPVDRIMGNAQFESRNVLILMCSGLRARANIYLTRLSATHEAVAPLDVEHAFLNIDSDLGHYALAVKAGIVAFATTTHIHLLASGTLALITRVRVDQACRDMCLTADGTRLSVLGSNRRIITHYDTSKVAMWAAHRDVTPAVPVTGTMSIEQLAAGREYRDAAYEYRMTMDAFDHMTLLHNGNKVEAYDDSDRRVKLHTFDIKGACIIACASAWMILLGNHLDIHCYKQFVDSRISLASSK